MVILLGERCFAGLGAGTSGAVGGVLVGPPRRIGTGVGLKGWAGKGVKAGVGPGLFLNHACGRSGLADGGDGWSRDCWRT
jgi:hypothetical protein